jgi:hypothetical protein
MNAPHTLDYRLPCYYHKFGTRTCTHAPAVPGCPTVFQQEVALILQDFTFFYRLKVIATFESGPFTCADGVTFWKDYASKIDCLNLSDESIPLQLTHHGMNSCTTSSPTCLVTSL